MEWTCPSFLLLPPCVTLLYGRTIAYPPAPCTLIHRSDPNTARLYHSPTKFMHVTQYQPFALEIRYWDPLYQKHTCMLPLSRLCPTGTQRPNFTVFNTSVLPIKVPPSHHLLILVSWCHPRPNCTSQMASLQPVAASFKSSFPQSSQIPMHPLVVVLPPSPALSWS